MTFLRSWRTSTRPCGVGTLKVLGTLVVCPDDAVVDGLLAVDGQQRLATASVVFAVK